MRVFCDTITKHVNNEAGFTIIVALILLLLLTIIGTTAINTSTTETMISSAEEVKRAALYVAESGVEHATAMLRSLFVARNQPEIQQALTMGSVPQPRWNFALNGAVLGSGNEAKPQPGPSSQWLARFNAGAPWITDKDMGNGFKYNVRVWNNADALDGSPNPEQKDTDGLIIVGAIATATNPSPNNPLKYYRAAVEVVLNGGIDRSTSTSAYTAQAGGGAGKNYNSADVGAITADKLTSTSLGAMAIP